MKYNQLTGEGLPSPVFLSGFNWARDKKVVFVRNFAYFEIKSKK